MNCPKCNYEVDSDAIFCENCGESFTRVEEPSTYAKTSTPIVFYLIKKPQIIGIVASIIVIILGILTWSGTFNADVYASKNSTSDGTTVDTDYSYYGGDAYTGMQQASADASNNSATAAKNIVLTNEILNDISGTSASGFNKLQHSIAGAVGMLIVSLGLLSGAYFTISLLKKED